VRSCENWPNLYSASVISDLCHKINRGDKVPILLGHDAVLLGMWLPAISRQHSGLFFKD
jgi:hypothetical protein